MKISEDLHQYKKSLKRSSVSFLIFTGGLLSLYLVGILYLNFLQKDYDYLINISGRQRMLSQKLLYLASSGKSKKEEFEKNLMLFKTSQREILEKASRDQVMFYKENINKKFSEYIILLETSQNRSIYDESQELLKVLDLAVKKFEQESNSFQEIEDKLGLLTYILTITLLVLSYYKIFLPQRRKIFESIELYDKEREKSIIKSRLVSIGELVAGIGHEINNPLTVAIGYVKKILRNRKNIGVDDEEINRIDKALTRIKSVSDGLRNFSRLSDQKENFCIVSSLKESVLFVKDIYRTEGVNIEFHFAGAEELYVYGNFGEIQQVLMNLIANAKDASDGLETRDIQVKLERVNKEVVIEVRDSGTGIPKDIQEKIFDSFFTTKGAGKGTGLGLALIKNIVEDHKGALSFSTEENKGTSFYLKLPLCESKASARYENLSVNPELNLSVLIVEDDEDIREVFREMFSDIGLKVNIACDGVEALESIKAKDYDIVFSDINMPKLSGVDLLEKIRQDSNIKQPKFIFTSGSINLFKESEENTHGDGILIKPFSEKELIDLVSGLFGFNGNVV